MSEEKEDEFITLKVAKAIPSDIGHGRVRTDQFEPGVYLELTGNRVSAAISWRNRPEDEKSGILRMDGIIRNNIKIEPGEEVKVRPIKPDRAEYIVIAPVLNQRSKIEFGAGIDIFAKNGLLNRVMVEGDKIFIPGMTLFSESLPFSVIETIPKGIVVCQDDTKVKVREEPIYEGLTDQTIEELSDQLLQKLTCAVEDQIGSKIDQFKTELLDKMDELKQELTRIFPEALKTKGEEE